MYLGCCLRCLIFREYYSSKPSEQKFDIYFDACSLWTLCRILLFQIQHDYVLIFLIFRITGTFWLILRLEL